MKIALIAWFPLECLAMQDIRIYVLFGYPGAGKGTFAEALKGKGYHHISTGGIFRAELRKKTSVGRQYKKEIETSSALLPDDTVKNIILNKIESLLEKRESLILDGFPKTVEQAQCLDNLLEKHSLEKNVYIVYLDVPLNVALARVRARETCSDCEKLYNLVTVRPQKENRCDVCGAVLIRRLCDTETGFYKRMELFNKTVGKVLFYYNSQCRLKKINATMKIDDFVSSITLLDKQELPWRGY